MFPAQEKTMFSKTLRMFALAALASAPLGLNTAWADEPDLSAFNGFGGKAGLEKVASLGIDKVLHDPRIEKRFTGANIPRLKAMLAVQFCVLLNGPCTYNGLDMKAAHAGMNLQDADFNALAEDFQIAMTELDIPFRTQNVLVAKLAPMEKQIVTK